ncbi:MAG TPA: ABC transporter ATP-binding protein, partial [Thermaerobacter sp.]
MPAWPGEGRSAAGAAVAERPAGPAIAAACRGLTVRYPDRDRPAVRDIDLVVGRGERVLLLGPSGCGKSTLAYALAGLIPDIIEATVRGELLKPARAGVLFQDPEAQFCMFTVEDEVAFSLENRRLPPEEMPPRIAAALAAAGLEVPWDQPLRELSGGMKQRLALATILALEPEVLFLDEPTAQLDPAGAVRVVEAIRQASAGRTVVIIEHNLDFVIDWVDRAVLLRPDGTLLADGAPATVLRRHEQELERFGIWRPRSWGPFWAGRVRTARPEPREERVEPHTPPDSSAEPVFPAPAPPVAAGDERKAHAGGEEAGGAEAGGAPEPLVELRRVTAGYDGRVVWRDVDVTVRRGEWIAVLGSNGSGKTTFLHVLAGLQQPMAGTVRHAPALAAHQGRLPAIGFVFQNPEHQFVTDTVYDEVALAARLEGLPEAEVRRRSEDLLRQFGLEALGAAHPYTLSQGQKRRLSVASMLAVPRQLLILDEPTFGQDARTAAALVQRLAGLHRQGVTIVMTTHDLELVAATATRVLVFGQGRLLYDGDPEGFLRDPARRVEAGLAPIGPTTGAVTTIAPTAAQQFRAKPTAQQSPARPRGLAASPGIPSAAEGGPSGNDQHGPSGQRGSSPRRGASRAGRRPLAAVNPAWKLVIHLVALAGVVAVDDPAALAAMLAVPVLLGWVLGGIGPLA